jgi:hypothetical protein
MSHFSKKRARIFPAISVLVWLAITVYGQDDMTAGGTDMSLEDLVNVKITIASKSE